ncbi:nuclease-related domain-containing protein [Gracilibacillus dipsosauri]|uniref:nuclease-related domain-containing protein n=1 Tax=Gracilibacillus dipsosauri TaxID=178340 RepID=UPI00240A9175
MYIKEISKPKLLIELEVIHSRLPGTHNHYAMIERDYINRLSGFKGEQSLDYYFSFLPEKDFLIFHSIRLKGATHYFQMDFLLLTQKYFLIVEVKNLSGNITFNEFNQMIQERDGELKKYDDPVLQVKHQAFQFKQWLDARKLPQIPVETIVVFTHPNVFLNVEQPSSPYIKNIVVSTKLLEHVKALNRKYSQKLIDSRQIKRISNLILKNHTELEQNLYEKYHINKLDLQTGVHCPECNRLPMIWMKGKWFCRHCNNISIDAHLKGISDYCFIHGGVATNKQLREFLHLPSENIMYKLLMKMNLPKTGNTKDRLYFLSEVR